VILSDRREQAVVRVLAEDPEEWMTLNQVLALINSSYADDTDRHVGMVPAALVERTQDFLHALFANGYLEVSDGEEIVDGMFRLSRRGLHARMISRPVQFVPAVDRLVPLDHNLPEYLRVKQGIEELRELVRSSNDLPDRDRILASLTAAGSLWQATELKVIQLKIGVVMAIEDAGRALKNTANAVAWALLVDAIKVLVKATIGLDLDKID